MTTIYLTTRRRKPKHQDDRLTEERMEDFMLRDLGRLLKSSLPTVRMSARINRKLYEERAALQAEVAELKSRLGMEDGAKFTAKVRKERG